MVSSTTLTPVSHQSTPQSNQRPRRAAALTLFATEDHEPLTTCVAWALTSGPLGAGVMPFPYASRETGGVGQGRSGSRVLGEGQQRVGVIRTL